MSKLDSSFWNNQAEQKKGADALLIRQTKFVADYFNDVCFSLLKRYVGFSRGCVLKTDLWNESVSTEREVLSYFNGSYQVGQDISSTVCKGAYARNKALLVSQGDVRNLPYKDGSFEVILDVSTIDHVSQSDAVKVIGEYSRLLADNGMLFLLYAQKYPFARHYWNNQFAGVYLLDSRLIGSSVSQRLVMVDDRGLDFVHGLFGLGPKRLIERFLIWHCPSIVRRAVVAVLFRLERSPASVLLRGYCGLRVHIAAKRGGSKCLKSL
jgi:SAM-dependent methyltransferase